ncbi:MAG: hypothetical protein HQ556_03310 [Candidatus Marinimicrobia bacterium]|nr:hypothetical protein [Candidatus Neomarinimicrobiota bacterium]
MIGNKMFDGVQWNTVTDYHLGYVEDNNNYYANYLSPAMYELKQRRYFTAGWWQDVEIDDGDATTSDDGEFGEVMTQNGINIYDTEVKIDKIGSVIKASVEYYDGITINQGGPYEQNIDVLEHVNAFVFMESEMTGEGNKKHYEHLNELIYEIQGWYTENYYNDYMLFFNSNGDILRYVTNQNFGDIKTPEIKKFNGDSWAAGWTSFDDSPINQFDYSNSFGTTSCYGIMDAIYSPLKQSYNGGISSGDVLGIAESGLTSYKTVRLDPFTEVVNGELTVQLPTVSSKTTEDGHGNSILKEFLYEQGIYRAESKSLTFGKVIVSHNNGELIEQKLYYNDLSVAEGIEYPDLEDPTLVDGWVLDGKLYQSSSKKQPGLPADILSSEDTQYESYLHDVENSIYQIRPIGSQTTIDDVTTVTSITFNSEGLVSQKEISQDISDPGSSTKKTVKTKYAYEKYSYPQDQNKYSQVYSTIVIDGTSNVEAKTWNIWTGSETQYYTRTHEHIWVGNPLEEDDQNAPDDPGESILVQSYEYDDYGNVIQVTDANGNITKLYYGSDNDPFTNDNKRELTGVQYVVGNIDNLPWTGDDIFGQFEYDPLFNKVAKIVNSDGSETSYEYDDFGRLSGIKNNSGNIISEYSYTFSRGVSSDDYDPDNPNLINIIDHPALGENIATELFSDGLGRSIETIRVQTGPEKDIIGAVEYDQNGRKFKEWNPYEIDLSLNEYQSDYAIGAGYNVETHYDVLGRKTKVIPQNETTADIDFEYGSEVVDGILRRFTKVTDEVGDEVIEYYDIFNNKIRSIHGYGTAEQATTDFTYNVLGNMTSFTNPEGQTIEFLFDPRGQMLESDHPDLGITKYRYDNNGNLKFEQNQIRANDSVYGWKFHRYDNLNRLVSSGLSITDPQIEPVTYNENDIIKQSFYYDDPISENSMGKLAVSFDHESMIAKIYHYDTEGRVSREQSLYNAVVANTPMEISVVVSDKGPIIDTETFEIDHDQFMFFSLQYGLAPHCHTKVTVERSGVVVDEVTDSGGSLGVLAGDIVTIEARNDYKFDEKVKLSLSYTLNELDQISGQHKTMSYFYNNLGNVTAITYPDGNKVESTYDDFGRLSAVPGYLDGDNEIGFRYTPNDQLSELHYGNGISFTQQYDERLRLSQVNQSGTGTHLGFDQDFTYFGDNNIQQISLRNSSSSIFNQSNFVYDSRDQLTYSIYSAGVGNDQSYKYDKNGNRIERNTVAYNYLEDVQENRVNNMLLGLGVSTTDFTYDEVGNLEEDHIEGLKYEYDWCNRLVSVLSDNWYQWEVDINYPMTFENQNNALRLFGANNKNWKYAKKKTTPVKVASTSDEVTIKFDIMRNAHVDMDYILIAFEDSVAGSGTLVRYYGRSSNNLLVRQYHTEGGSKINTTVFTGAVPITGVSWTNIKLTLNDLDGTFRFELHNDDDDIDLTVALDDKISGLNSIKFNFIEADFSIDNIQISSADQYPYSYVDNFDGSFSTGLAGQIARYYYNTEGERLIKASPSGYIKYITDNNNRPYAETDAQGVVAESYIYGGSQRLVKLDRIGTTPIGTPFENNLEFITDMTNGHGASFSVNPDNREGDNSIQVNISYESSYSFGNFTIDGAPSYDAAVTSYIHVWVKPGANAEYLKFFVKDETASSPGNTYYDQFFGDIDGDGKFEVGEDLIANEWNELWLDANNLYHSGHTGSSSPPEISTFHAHANNPLTSGSPDVVFSFDHVYATISPYSTFFYHSDHLGSARRISDTDGGLEWMREYYPFGEIRGTYGAVENSKYHFTGQERDFETGLDYSWHRFRSTEHGAFSQVDAKWIEFASLSPYHYVFNNPISLIDQNGLNPESLMAPIGDGGHREYLPAEPNPIKLTQKQQAVVDVTADVTVAVVATTLAVGTLMTPVPSDNLATGKLLKYASIKMGSALVAAGGLVSLIDVDDNESKATDGISGSGSILQGAGNIASKSYFKGVYQILKGLFDTSKATSGLEELLNEEIELIDEEEIKNTTAPVEVLEQN